MAKYIDADRLRAEIIRLRKDKPFHNDSSFLAYLHGLSRIEDFIASLQQEQPEVDLEKAVEEANNLWESINTGHEYSIIYSKNDFLGICLHMYELGQNSK